MRKILLYIGIFFIAVACSRKQPRLQNGDLLFVAGNASQMEEAIAAATGAKQTPNYTHVGIVVKGRCGAEGRYTTCNCADSVIEASTEGVRGVALQTFLSEAGHIDGRPAVAAMRLRDTTGVTAAIHRARGMLSLPYDYSFQPGNDKLYCSELIWECYRSADGAPLFPSRPMRFRAADGTMPAFWTDLFETLGEPIPEGVPGTNPNEMAQDPLLEEVGRWF